MTEHNPPAPPPDDPKPGARATKKAAPKIGDVLVLANGAHALVVGSEKVRHQHLDANGDPTGSETLEHPLIIDLPPARRYEIEHTPAS